ncbi:MAG TPA: hypothetical protein VGO00_27390, partial [Kofleriaceae bacterium]|nr:hypothetical protein [Kofleriaceae bacterium]
MFLPAESSDANLEMIETHELTHAVSHAVIRQQPRWFAEGLAYYFETLRHDARGVSIGLLPHVAREKRRMTLANLRACTEFACSMNSRFDVTAWLLFDYLENTQPAQLEKYIDLLASGRGDDAFDEVFTTPLDQIDREMNEWARRGRTSMRHYDVTYLPFSVKTRALGEADILAARAILETISGASKERPLAEIDAALKQQPTNVIANMLAANLGRAITPAAATAIAAA